MSAPQRPGSPPVVERLLAEPQRFEFFQAVRVLQRWLSGAQGLTPDQVLTQRLRFGNSLALSFPAGEIESLRVQHAATVEAGAAPRNASTVESVALVPTFFGLLGSQGTLPHHYTEQVAHHELLRRDPAARAFLDLFTNRATALFHAGWMKHRLHLQYEQDRQQRFLPLVLALAGLGPASLRQRMEPDAAGVDDHAVAFFAGTVQGRHRSAVQIEQVLAGYLQVPVQVRSFVGRWYALPAEATTALGRIGTLGADALVGERVWQRNLAIRIVLGPLDRTRYRRFLPGGAGERALRHWVGLLLGVSLDVEIQLRLQREAVLGIRLDGADEAGRLGWDSFLSTQPEPTDRDDVIYDLPRP